MNMTGDADLYDMRDMIMTELTGYNPDTLRCDPDVRRDVASKANDIMRKMAGFMGDAQ